MDETYTPRAGSHTEIELSEEVQSGVYDFLMETGFTSIFWDADTLTLYALGVAVEWDGDKAIPQDDTEDVYEQSDFEEGTSTFHAFEDLEALLAVALPADQTMIIGLDEATH
jgi:hypothetical protein